ncbi:MAG: hypothetical protein J7M18_07780 [Candidatus Eremiobacteraeota bacterium]|nr:hypothetical protein [Candidatus Eremiobacteraeota bacterium]
MEECDWKGTPKENLCRKRIEEYLKEIYPDFQLGKCYHQPGKGCTIYFHLGGQTRVLGNIDRVATFEMDECTGRFGVLCESIRTVLASYTYKGPDAYKAYVEHDIDPKRKKKRRW